jgi:hypothetical protein
MTGHADGLITLQIDEADDARREAMRPQLREPYCTLLGHLRHEVGHYYWQMLVDGTPWIAGPPADWSLRHVSSYAGAHPWEDWAETWAHYLHMVDTVDTALSFGLHAAHVQIESEPFGADALWQPAAPGCGELSRVRQRLDRADQRAQRDEPQHGATRFLSVRAAACRRSASCSSSTRR